MRPILALTLAALALPATAQAAPIPGASYGGGVPPTGFGTTGIMKSAHVDAHITTDGTRARVRVYMPVRCGAKAFVTQRFDASGPIDASGKVVAQARSLRYAGPGSTVRRPRGLGSVNVTFDGQRASGTIRGRVTVRIRGKRRRCDSGDVAIQLRNVAPDPATPGAATAGGLYFGTTASSWRGRISPVSIRVNAAATRITGFIFGARLACPGKDEYLANISPPMTIRSDGTFRRTEKFTARFNNATDRTTVLVTGRFTAAGATGTVRITQKTRFSNGARVTCRSGTRRWTAVL